jgi:hypothetical protein
MMELQNNPDCPHFDLLDTSRHESNRKLFHTSIKNKNGQTPYDVLMSRYNERNPFDTNLNELVSIMEKVQPKKKGF